MSKVSPRYATALYDVCSSKGSTAKVLEALTALSDCIQKHPDIAEALSSPLISADNKVALLKSALSTNLPAELDSFFKVIAHNNRFSSIPGIAGSFKEIVDKSSGVMTGVVRSATALSDSEKNQIQKVIEEKLARKVSLQYLTDEKMIGGLEARVGSYIFEDSIKSHMQKLNDFITRRVQ